MTERFRFEKSWGAETTSDGARFRIWAPSQDAVRLRAGDSNLPMQPADQGWFELATDAVPIDGGYGFVLNDGRVAPDPAARAQIADVHGLSRLIDPLAYEWRTGGWTGRPLEEVVVYELHTGAFSPEGDFDGVRRRLDHLAQTGVTALELMPVAAFGGSRGWGYDGVLLYAPHRAYGGPEGLKRLVDAAHERGLMVFLDVVYNHFGPEGSYLHLYAPDFFHPERRTPWGSAIAYEKPPVRAFFTENSLYWLEEYRLDGLRFDAIDQIDHQSEEPILDDIAEAIRSRATDRHIHLMTEDDRNITRLHERDAEGRARLFSTEWNDDFHHAAHAIATGERDGYYVDFAADPVAQLGKALATGFVFQGETSAFRQGERRGVSSAHLPPTAFLNFLQNHDQIGNRAFSERLTALAEPAIVEALTAILLLSPQIPLIFMGEEWGETRPFGFFTDFHGELGDLVREGRRKEFAKWPAFASEENRARIADPNAPETFEASKLDWSELDEAVHRRRFEFVRTLLDVRRREIMPLIPLIGGNAGRYAKTGEKSFAVRWALANDAVLALYANLGESALPPSLRGREGGWPQALLSGPSPTPNPSPQGGGARLIFAYGEGAEAAFRSGELPSISVIAAVEPPPERRPDRQ